MSECRLGRVRECQSSEKLGVRHASAVVGFIPRVIISSSKVVRVHRVGGVIVRSVYRSPLSEFQVDIGMSHRFGDLCYVVDYVRDRSGKLAPVASHIPPSGVLIAPGGPGGLVNGGYAALVGSTRGAKRADRRAWISS